MNGQTNLDMWSDAVDAVMREQCLASRAEAAEIARRRHPELAAAAAKAPGAMYTQTQQSSGGGQAVPTRYGDPERELDSRARRIAAEERVTYAQGYVHALNRDPQLYLDFLRAQQRKLEAQEAGRRA